MKNERYGFRAGFADGLPIAVGYLAVSFGFGVLAANAGLPVWLALLLSMTNLTSAGQLAGLSVLVSAGSAAELIATEFVINIRYALMSLTLSQKADADLTTPHRLLLSVGITDEVFGVASARDGLVGKRYLYGLILMPYLGWSGGTLLGAVLGGILPMALRLALGIALYAMFVAIILPPARRERGVTVSVVGAMVLSCLFSYLPLLREVPSGFAVICAAVPVAAFAAWRFPIHVEEAPE